VDKTGRAVIF